MKYLLSGRLFGRLDDRHTWLGLVTGSVGALPGGLLLVRRRQEGSMVGLRARKAVSRLKGFVRVVAVIGGLALVSTCASAKEIRWKEQVRLSNGDLIVVERGETLRSVYSGGPLRPGWLFDEAWLKAELPGVGETAWRGALSPLALNVTPRGEWYLLGIVVANRGRESYKLPVGKYYVAFKLIAGDWQRVPFADFPTSFQPNLLGDTFTLFVEGQEPNGALVDLDLKNKVDSAPALSSKYKRVDRSLGD
jgi:hypothetical protein